MRYVSFTAMIEKIPALALLACAQLLVACSLAPPPGRSITIALPQGSGSGTVTAARNQSAHARGTATAPAETSFASFNCYAINVTAADIPPVSGVTSCAGEAMGLVAGFVPASAGSITIQVPDGAARNFQLIGLGTNVACPNFGNILNLISTGGVNNNPTLQLATQGLGQPYVLGSATSDIGADTTLTIDASFTPGTSQVLFEGCGGNGGQGYPPTAAIGVADDLTGLYGGNNASFAFPFAAAPSAALNGSELSAGGSAATALSGDPSQEPAAPAAGTPALYDGEGVAEETTSPGYRSVIQLRWDASTWSTISTPYLEFNLLVTGGLTAASESAAVCQQYAMRGLAGVSAAVWDNTRSQWLPIAQGIAPGNQPLQWYGSSQGSALVPVSELLMTSSVDGHPYVVVNVESNFVAGNGCGSGAYVAGAQVHLLPNPTTTTTNSLISVQPVGVETSNNCNGSVCKYNTVNGANIGLLVNGGIPPYVFQETSGGGTLDTTTGHLAAGAAGDTETIQVTDSSGVNAPVTIQYNVVNPAVPNGVIVQQVDVDGAAAPWPVPVVAGQCVSVELAAVGFGYSPLALTTVLPLSGQYPKGTLDYATSPYSSSANATATCPESMSQPQIGPSGTWLNFPVTGTGLPGMISLGVSGESSSVNIPVNVQPAALAATGISATTPKAVNEGVCTPVLLTLQDEWGNDVPAGGSTTESLTSLYFTSQVFADAACGSPDMLPQSKLGALTPGEPASLWIKNTNEALATGSSENLSASVSLAETYAVWDYYLYPAGEATQLLLVGPPLTTAMTGTCAVFSVTPTDSAGNAADVSVSAGAYADFTFVGPWAQVYADEECTTAVAGNQLTLNQSGPTTFSIMIPSYVQLPWSFDVWQPSQASCDNAYCIPNSNVISMSP